MPSKSSGLRMGLRRGAITPVSHILDTGPWHYCFQGPIVGADVFVVGHNCTLDPHNLASPHSLAEFHVALLVDSRFHLSRGMNGRRVLKLLLEGHRRPCG